MATRLDEFYLRSREREASPTEIARAAELTHMLHHFSVLLGAAVDIDGAKRLLADAVRRLENLDPLLPLMQVAEQEEWDLDEREIYLGAYKLSVPSMKDLNDRYLGPKHADEFVDALHELIRQTFPEHQQTISTFFKGGHYLVEFGGETEASTSEYRSNLFDFEGKARHLLAEHAQARLTELEATGGMEGNISALKELIANPVLNISFGLERMRSSDPSEMSVTIVNAQRAANMARRRRETSPAESQDQIERCILQEFTLEYLLKDLLRTRAELLIEFDADPEKWEGVFEVQNGQIVMNPIAIARYRKGVLDLDEEMLAFVDRYCRNVNVLDVLKNYRVNNFDAYMQRIQGLFDLCKKAKSAPEDVGEILSLLREISDELEVSIKDEGEGLTKTHWATVKGMMESGIKSITGLDHIGFGGTNLQAYERDLNVILGAFGVTEEEFTEFIVDGAIDHGKLDEFVENKLEAAAEDPELKAVLLSPGDIASKYLRTMDAKLADHFGEGAVLNGQGGDESLVVATVEEGEIHDDLCDPRVVTLETDDFRLRVASVLSDITLPQVDDVDNVSAVQFATIRTFISILAALDREHGNIKNEGGNVIKVARHLPSS